MTGRHSVRAQAQEIYGELSAKADAARVTQTPTLTLPLSGGGNNVVQRGRGHAESGEGAEFITARAAEDLTARVRALYEDSVAPVREIAALAGVTERTIYKYARKHNWKPRYRWRPDGARPQGVRDGAMRGRSWQPRQDFAPAKGAGGRFIARAEAGKPFAVGLKATDPAAAAQASARCTQAAALAAEAKQQVALDEQQRESLRAMTEINRAQRNLANYLEERDKADWERPRHPGWPRRRLRPPRENDPVEHALRVSLHAAIDWWDAVSKS
jgi:hypothetical protein